MFVFLFYLKEYLWGNPNIILQNHADWLALYYPEDVVNECRRQALEYKQNKDPRQTGARLKK